MNRRPADVPEDASPQVPWLSVVFGFGPMLPLLAGAAAAWALPGEPRGLVLTLTLLWACGILMFLAGVRRGLSFRTRGGPTLVQMATMLGLYGTGFCALVAVEAGRPLAGTVLLLVGYGALVCLDPLAAESGEAPRHFARLRPAQIPLALLSLAALLALEIARAP
ncbi:hypothetical protein OPKNFCMD_2667 [Methylobacterium crusticola]|uniref:DUF3429 domain-containing protein n=1 Tax=Methylobacterium crusticola TaxID=1697972 RepID=A0ABQ4QXZ5_9HYPH|nr:DUF3429 family protein [Methylobacterium crusticola]GJD49931.1 hypothetical protein OPKNFCMD_2667 [Methylobacterium crusticola]